MIMIHFRKYIRKWQSIPTRISIEDIVRLVRMINVLAIIERCDINIEYGDNMLYLLLLI